MPLPTRDLSARTSRGRVGPVDSDLRERALAVLLAPALEAVVALVCWRDGELVHVADASGRCALAADGASTLLAGRDPLADQDPYGLDDRCYPLAAVRLHSLFAEQRAPDLAVVHAGGHDFTDRGGHRGEHGSLNAVQSRAPLVLSGAGVTARGVVDGVARTVDVGATLTRLAGGSHEGMDGRPIELAVPGARHVVGLLWDGAPHLDVLAMAAAGELPNVARLLDRGCALRGGAVAEFPSVTLVNHTSALTGLGPGRHGIVNNAYFDRGTGRQAVPNATENWVSAMQFLREGVTTVWERVAAADPDAVTACIDEPCDVGATYSTFALVRASAGAGTGSLVTSLPPAEDDPLATQEHVRASPDYRWASQVDAVGLQQVLGLWRDGEPPRLTWWNTTLTDGAQHAGGPGSAIGRAGLVDSDRRLGVWLDLLAQRGLVDDVVVLLTADHGMQTADPAITGDWAAALDAAGVPYRDEAHGFLYLGADLCTGDDGAGAGPPG